MEQTNNLEKKGNWFFIVKKPNAAAASNFLDNKFQNLYQSIVPNNQNFDMVPITRHAKSKAEQ
eukprot:8673198-Ditylum_brightwellii.AAC.1